MVNSPQKIILLIVIGVFEPLELAAESTVSGETDPYTIHRGGGGVAGSERKAGVQRWGVPSRRKLTTSSSSRGHEGRRGGG